MSDDTSLTEVVSEEVADQVEVNDVLGGGDLGDQVDLGEVGASVGREFGQRIGRELGEAIGREVHLAIRRGSEEGKDRTEILEDAKTSVRDALSDAFGDVDGRDSFVSLVKEVAEEGGLAERLSEGATGDEEPDEDEQAQDEQAEAEETEDEEGTGADADGEDDESEDEPSTEDLEGLRRETLEDLLGIMSYGDLQSVAKDVGVKANLSREEMTDKIIDEVATGAENEEESNDEIEAD